MHINKLRPLIKSWDNRSAIKGFTLAEVLITLSIIGVITTLTIPSIVKNYQEASWHTAWKKKYSEISRAYMMARAEQGEDTGMAMELGIDQLRPYLKITKMCGYETSGSCTCWHKKTQYLNGTTDTNCGYQSYILADGSFIRFNNHSWDNCTGWGNACADITVDINGFKGPNIVGKDIFVMYLMRNTTQPGGHSLDNFSRKTCIQPPNAGWDGESNTGYGCSLKYLQE